MTSLAMEPTVITEPGVYDLPDAEYHRDPVPGGSLSYSSSKRLLAPSCPAVFAYEREHGQQHKAAYDLGHAAHAAVLGVGAEVVIIDAPDWKTKAAQDQRKAAYAAGKTPLLASEAETVEAMAVKLQEHPIASALLDAKHGKPEQSLFRQEERHGLWLRSRVDWLGATDDNGHAIVPDYKTTIAADPASISKTVATFGYHGQQAWYTDMVLALGLAESVSFGFIFQLKTAPYLVTVVELDDLAVEAGRRRNDTAIDVYAACRASGQWPGYADDEILQVTLPTWAMA